jgi:hypothetical protein
MTRRRTDVEMIPRARCWGLVSALFGFAEPSIHPLFGRPKNFSFGFSFRFKNLTGLHHDVVESTIFRELDVSFHGTRTTLWIPVSSDDDQVVAIACCYDDLLNR